MISTGLILVSGAAMALPQNGQVVGGSATIQQVSPTQLDINQSSNRAVLNWRSFSIGSNETTVFNQPSSSSVAVNRVTGVDPSDIAGHLSANGQVVLINPNGILFQKGSRVDVGGLVASTTDMSTKNAMNGNYVFDRPSKSANASIVNNGVITARQGGLVALVAPNVVNNGVINARLGKVALASGNEWTLDLYGDKLVSFAAPNDVVKPVNGGVGVTNNGKIYADAGTVQLTANDAKGLVDNSINMNGVIEASSVSKQGGTILLNGGSNGVKVAGTMNAVGTTGGAVSVTGSAVTLAGATVNASGLNGGGTIAIGGDLHGAGSLAQAETVYVGSSSILKADAIQQGNGGVISVWSDGDTSFAGKASAKGGFAFGNGGTVETSGHNLNFAQAVVDTEATNGTTGTWILDPYNLTINATGAAAIDSALASNNVLVQTNSVATATTAYGTQSSGEGDITVASAVSWNSANSLTLSAYDNIVVNAPISDSGTGNVILRADNTGNGTGAVSISAPVTTGGAISIYYDAPNYQAPTIYTTAQASAADGVTAYMLVNTQSDLQRINSALCPTTSALCGNYALGNNIALTGAYTQIGDIYHVFSGLFDGNGGIAQYGITGLNVTGTSYVGLFGDNSGPIRNVTVSGTVVGAGNYIGGLVGFNAGTLTNDSFTGTVLAGTSSDNVAGLVGGNYIGSVINSSFSGLVSVGSGSADVGGIAGANTGLLANNAASGSISVGDSNVYVGGYVGDNYGGTVNGGSFAGNVSTGSVIYGVGGFAGDNTGTIIHGSFSGNVNAGPNGQYIGGFAGSNYGTMDGGVAAGSVVAANNDYFIGGYAGFNEGVISGVSSTAHISAGSSNGGIGGLVGLNYQGTVTGGVYNGALVVGNNSTSVGGVIGENDGTLLGGGATDTINVGNNVLRVGDIVGYNNGGYVSGTTAYSAIIGGNNDIYLGGGIGQNDAGGMVTAIAVGGSISAGSGTTGVGGLVGYNGSDPVPGRGSFAAANATVAGSTSTVNITVGTGSFAIGSLIGANTIWTTANSGTGATYTGVYTGNSATGTLSVGAGTTWWHYPVGGDMNLAPFVDVPGTITLNITPTDTGKVYGQADPTVYPYNVTGLYEDDTAAEALSGGITRQTGQNAGTYAYETGSLVTNSNYTISLAANFVITPASLIVDVNNTGKVYGSTPSFSASYVGLTNGDASGVVTGLTYTSAGATTTAPVGAYGITASGAMASNYTITYGPNGTLTVTPASLLVTANNTSKTYGSTATYTSSYVGLVAGDTSSVVSGITYVSAGTTSTANVGTYSISETGASASNYTITYGPNATLSVTPASLIVSPNSTSKTYGSSPTYTSSYTGLVAGDTSSVVTGTTYTSAGTTSTAGVGTYSISESGAAASNYTITYGPNGTLTVNPAPLTVSANNTSKTYGSSPTYTSSYTGLVAGDTSSVVSGITYVSAGTTSTANVGTYSISETGATASNYTIVYGPNGTLTVNPAPLTVTTSGTKTYGSSPTYTNSYTGLTAGDTSSVVTGLTYASGGATSTAPVGTYGITTTGGSASNYTITYGSTGSLAVTPAPLTVTANNASRSFGTADPTFTASFSGLVAGDTSNVVTNLSFSSSDNAASLPGQYTITPYNGSASNYAISYLNGILTVTGSPLGPIGPTGGITPVTTPATTGTVNYLASINGLLDGSLGGLNLINNSNQTACLRINADLRPPREQKPLSEGNGTSNEERPVDCSAPLKFQNYPQ